MEALMGGELVKVAAGGPELDGIVYDVPSHSKVVVAVVDAARGPVLKTVHPRTLTERTGEGPDDRALQLLLRRTPPPQHALGRGARGGGRGRAGYSHPSGHRTTGK